MPLISPPTRRAFQESYAYHAGLRLIREDFDDAGVERGDDGTFGLGERTPVSPGVRRALVDLYYSNINWTSNNDVRRVLDAFEGHLRRLEDTENGEWEIKRLNKHLAHDGFSYNDGKITDTRSPTAGLGVEISSIDIAQVKRSIEIMNGQVESAPEVAVGMAKNMVESCCKAILQDANVEFSEKEYIPKLAYKTADALHLLPENISERQRGEKAMKEVLGSLARIVQGMAELRNLYGSGHGKGPGHSGLSPRHARLAAGAAATLATFWLETAEFRKNKAPQD